MTYSDLVARATLAIEAINALLPSHGIAIDTEATGYEPVTDRDASLYYEANGDASRRMGYTPTLRFRIGGWKNDVWLQGAQIDDAAFDIIGQVTAGLGCPIENRRDMPKSRIGPRAGKFQAEYRLGITPKGNLLVVGVVNEQSAAKTADVDGTNCLLVSPARESRSASFAKIREHNANTQRAIAREVREFIAEFDIEHDVALNPVQKVAALLRLPHFLDPLRQFGSVRSASADECVVAFGTAAPDAAFLGRLETVLCRVFKARREDLPKGWRRYGLTLSGTGSGNWTLVTVLEGIEPASKVHVIGKSWLLVARDLTRHASGDAEAMLLPHFDTLDNIRAEMANAQEALEHAIREFEDGLPKSVVVDEINATALTPRQAYGKLAAKFAGEDKRLLDIIYAAMIGVEKK